MGDPLKPGWTEIDDPNTKRIPLRHFEATYTRDGESRRVELGSLDPSDEACLKAINDAEASIASEQGTVVT